MKIAGNTVGTPMPRTNYNQTDSTKADYLKGKPDLDKKIQDAQTSANNAQTSANNAQTSANNAQTAADNAQTTANDAKSIANDALPKAGGTMTGALNIGTPTESTHAANKEYVDEKHKTFTATITVNDWVGEAAPYTQVIGIEGILESDKPHITPVYADDLETKLAQKEAWNMVCEAVSADGSITFVCFEDKPATAVPIEIEVNR